MYRKVACAAFFLVLGAGLALADEFGASIMKVSDGKVTFAKREKGKKLGDEMTLPVADNVKVVTGKFNKEDKKIEAGEELPGGLKNDVFKDIGDKGVPARIVTDADGKKITEIRVITFKKKSKDL